VYEMGAKIRTRDSGTTSHLSNSFVCGSTNLMPYSTKQNRRDIPHSYVLAGLCWGKKNQQTCSVNPPDPKEKGKRKKEKQL
jgi:hypothetical protein